METQTTKSVGPVEVTFPTPALCAVPGGLPKGLLFEHLAARGDRPPLLPNCSPPAGGHDCFLAGELLPPALPQQKGWPRA